MISYYSTASKTTKSR